MKCCTYIVVLLLTSALVACGTTSDIKPTPTAEAVASPAPKPAAAIDLSAYDKVIVLDFVDATDKSKLRPDEAREYSETMASATHVFPDLIAQKVRETGAFQEVVRGPSPGKALSISGRITRLSEGNASLRLWIGMGAGSSYFDATIDLSDGDSGARLGEVTTDKNSWVLGGVIAATQTVPSFMEGAAAKIAEQLREGKKGRPVAQVK